MNDFLKRRGIVIPSRVQCRFNASWTALAKEAVREYSLCTLKEKISLGVTYSDFQNASVSEFKPWATCIFEIWNVGF